MSRLAHYFLLLSSLLLSVELSAASSTNMKERRQQFLDPEKLGEAIEYEWMGGTWHYETLEGNFRMLITAAPENEANKLYIQWWRYQEEGTSELAYSLSVQELNAEPNYKFDSVECLNKACDRLMIKASHAYEEYEQKVFVTLTDLGRYKIEL